MSGGLGLIITSSKELECRYTSENGRHERYFGRISKFGLDIGAHDGRGHGLGRVRAGKRAEARRIGGDYAGVGASATLGAGLGANALVGGSNRSIALQPLSVQTQGGLDLAGGVEFSDATERLAGFPVWDELIPCLARIASLLWTN